jgi:hypothetical protein
VLRLQQLLSTLVWWVDEDEHRSGWDTERWRLPKLKIDTSDVMRSMDDEDAEVLLVLLLLISNGAIVIISLTAVCVGEPLVRSLDKKSSDKQLSVVMSLALQLLLRGLDVSSPSGSSLLLLYLICLLFGRIERIASSVS